MTRSLRVDGAEYGDITRLSSFAFTEAAYRGEVGEGGFDVDSAAGAVSVPAMKTVTLDEWQASPVRLFSGFAADRGVGRGPFNVDSDAQWDVRCVDRNALLDDPLIRVAAGNRGSESDYARVIWLIGWLNGEGYALGSDYVPNTNTVTLDASDYRSRFPRDVLDECAEQSGKNFFIFWDGTQYQLFYDLAGGTAFSSTYKLSSVPGDADGATVFAPEWPNDVGLTVDPQRIYSGVEVSYGSSSKVFVQNATTLANFRRRDTTLFDSSVTNSTSATQLANKYLDSAASEEATITTAVTLPDTYGSAFRAGERAQIKFPHLGYAAYTWMRILRRTIEPAGEERKAPDRYRVTLVLQPNVKVTRFGGRGSPSPTSGIQPACLEEKTTADGTSHTISQGSGGTYAFHFGTYMSQNVSWTSAPCGIGGGAWSDNFDYDLYYTFTAPAAGSGYTHGLLEVGTFTSTGTAGAHGIDIRVMAGEPTAFNQGTTIGHVGPAGGGLFWIPLEVASPSSTFSIIFHPDWLSERIASGDLICLDPTFSLAFTSGQGDSGTFGYPSVHRIHWYGLCAGANGVASLPTEEVADGSRVTFTLSGWDGTGLPLMWVAGLFWPEFTYDTSAKTVTFVLPPPIGAIVAGDYHVTA